MNDVLEEVPRPFIEMAWAATITGSIETLVNELGCSLKDDRDDLDELKTVTLKCERLLFELMRYRGEPPNLFSIFIPAQQQDWEKQLNEVLGILKIPSSRVYATNSEFMRWPG